MKKAEREQLLKEKLVVMKEYENGLYEKGCKLIAGVDEVGRGPLAGPVVAVACVLPCDFSLLGVDDSKKVSPKKREELFEKITKIAIAYGVGMVDHDTIDDINILEATKLAMKLAIEDLQEQLNKHSMGEIDHILLDAVSLDEVEYAQTSIIKGDSKSVSIAAASILAKVIRDNMMIDFSNEYPHYGFESNKGYGTKAHYEGIREHGLCKIHRRTFLKGY